jgi:hypothetical protein
MGAYCGAAPDLRIVLVTQQTSIADFRVARYNN